MGDNQLGLLEETIAKVLKGHELTLCCNLDMDYFIKEMVDSFASLVQRTQQALEDTKLNDFECNVRKIMHKLGRLPQTRELSP